MSTIRAITKGAGALRPFVKAVRRVERSVSDTGSIAVLDGEPQVTARLREILGTNADEPLRDGPSALVYPAVASHDPTLAAAVLAGAKRQGRRVLAVVIGSAADRTVLERAILQAEPLERSNLAYVRSLDDRDTLLSRIATFLDEDAVPVARRHPALRGAVADDLIVRASRQAGAIGVAAVVPGADLPAMTLIQVRLVAQLAALHGRPLDGRRGIEMAGVLAGALGWRAVARRAVAAVPIAGFAVRGGIGYSATRAVGEAARTYFEQAGDRADQPLDGLNRAIAGALKRKGRR